DSAHLLMPKKLPPLALQHLLESCVRLAPIVDVGRRKTMPKEIRKVVARQPKERQPTLGKWAGLIRNAEKGDEGVDDMTRVVGQCHRRPALTRRLRKHRCPVAHRTYWSSGDPKTALLPSGQEQSAPHLPPPPNSMLLQPNGLFCG